MRPVAEIAVWLSGVFNCKGKREHWRASQATKDWLAPSMHGLGEFTGKETYWAMVDSRLHGWHPSRPDG